MLIAQNSKYKSYFAENTVVLGWEAVKGSHKHVSAQKLRVSARSATKGDAIHIEYAVKATRQAEIY